MSHELDHEKLLRIFPSNLERDTRLTAIGSLITAHHGRPLPYAVVILAMFRRSCETGDLERIFIIKNIHIRVATFYTRYCHLTCDPPYNLRSLHPLLPEFSLEHYIEGSDTQIWQSRREESIPRRRRHRCI